MGYIQGLYSGRENNNKRYSRASKDLNKVLISGRLGSDFIPDDKIISGYNETIKFIVESESPLQEKVPIQTICVAYGYLSFKLQNNCIKGDNILIEGTLLSRRQDKTLYSLVLCDKIVVSGKDTFVELLEDNLLESVETDRFVENTIMTE